MKFTSAKLKEHPKKVLAFTILFFIIAGNAFAQTTFKEAIKNLQPGRVITLSNDTLQGHIDNREWSANPASIEFIQQEQKKRFTVTDIKGFRVNGQTYRSTKVDLDVSPIRIPHLNITATPTIVQDTTVFLRLLAEGELSLYYLMDAANKKHFFYQQKGQPIKVLEYYQHYHDATKQQLAVKTTYKNQLKNLSAACTAEALHYDISYTAREMVRFFNKLNTCLTGEEPASEMPLIPKPKHKFRGAVFAGAHLTTFYSSDYIYGRDNVGTFSRLIPSLGLNVDYIFPRSLEQFSISSSLQYQHQQIDRSYRVGKSWQISDKYDLNHMLLAINFRYTIPFIGQARPYLSAGPNLKYFMNPSMTKRRDILNYEKEVSSSQENYFEYAPFVPGFSIGVGTEYKRFNFEVRYYKDSNKQLIESSILGVNGSIRATSLSTLLYYNIFN